MSSNASRFDLRSRTTDIRYRHIQTARRVAAKFILRFTLAFFSVEIQVSDSGMEYTGLDRIYRFLVQEIPDTLDIPHRKSEDMGP
ncbi:hypothetical protein CEXT_612391 [Caerostris extrusa]|uniref:Uncharacterized protein n=1 Tax=Caerostris extrusa TaxID=172846 RepID=A0AAV4WDT1_CAEEX|nr:hypothetical protein CEXT_612391 [Caerostris extrusa]